MLLLIPGPVTSRPPVSAAAAQDHAPFHRRTVMHGSDGTMIEPGLQSRQFS